MTIKEAKAKGYELVKTSPFEVGLIKNGKGIKTWWVKDFGGYMPTLDNGQVQEAIRINEQNP